MLAALGAGDVEILDHLLELGVLQAVHGGDFAFGFQEILDELVGAEAGFALAAVEQRIGEAADVTGSDPGLRVHQDRGVETDVIGAFLNEFLPPGVADVVFELAAERAVVPGVGKAAVNFGAGEDKAAVFAQRDDFFHRGALDFGFGFHG